MLDKYTGLFLFAAFIGSSTQIILKISADTERENRLKEYLNIQVLGAYIIMFIATNLNIIAYRGVELKQGPILEATGYIWVLLLSWFFLHERLSFSKVIGIFLIISGIIVFII